ncbi:MAG: hypothetical protein IIC95_04295 [Chloroflexi bacterium]|nr:hypothetical protein [Chloroflexota bacterium]
MSRLAAPRLLWLVALGAVLAAPACGTSAPSPGPAGDAPSDEQAVGRLLTVSDLAAAGVRTDGLEVRLEDLRALAEAVDAEQVREIESWYGLHFERSERVIGLSLSVIDFDSAERAGRQLDLVESGPAFEPMASPVGDRSAWAGPRGGAGAALAFVAGRRLVTLHSIAALGQEPLVDVAQVEALARLVEGRLAGL